MCLSINERSSCCHNHLLMLPSFMLLRCHQASVVEFTCCHGTSTMSNHQAASWHRQHPRLHRSTTPSHSTTPREAALTLHYTRRAVHHAAQHSARTAGLTFTSAPTLSQCRCSYVAHAPLHCARLPRRLAAPFHVASVLGHCEAIVLLVCPMHVHPRYHAPTASSATIDRTATLPCRRPVVPLLLVYRDKPRPLHLAAHAVDSLRSAIRFLCVMSGQCVLVANPILFSWQRPTPLRFILL